MIWVKSPFSKLTMKYVIMQMSYSVFSWYAKYKQTHSTYASIDSHAVVEEHILRIMPGNSIFRGMVLYLHSYVKWPMATSLAS